ncbi:MAG: CoA transferase [Alphaproteobacteria bacterium]|nr:CoA transferase [Alphaproteobacteria bacterium]
MSEDRPILEGIKVLDFGSFVAAPAATTVMSDFGADVIKIEQPGVGDLYRYLPLVPQMPDCDLNYPWLVVSRNKRSMTLDIKKPGAREPFEKLVKECDVFVTNLPPAVLERLKIRYEDLVKINPRLVHASFTGFGELGEEASNPGYDATAWWARTGLMEHSRAAGSNRATMPPAAGDNATSMSLLSAIMMALYRRERTGKGSRVYTSLLASGVWANSVALQSALCGAKMFNDPANPQVDIQNLVNHFECRDGRAFIIAVMASDRGWPTFAACIGRPDLATDPRFANVVARGANTPALLGILQETFAQKDWAEWREILLANRVTVAPINRVEDAIQDPQILANRMLVDLDLGGGRSVKTINSPIWVEGIEKVKPRAPAELGQHTEEILRSTGCSDADIAALREAGAI